MNRLLHKYFFTTLLLLVAGTTMAQVTVQQTVDSMQMWIGQQAHIRLQVSLPDGAKLQWPVLKKGQQLSPGLEYLEATKPDTTEHDGQTLTVQRQYTITAWEERIYPIPAMKVSVNGKVYQGTPAAIKVITMEVDTLHPNQFFPPKDVQDNPFLFSEWLPWILLGLLIVPCTILMFYLFIRIKENKPIITTFRIIKRIPPHKRALKEIEQIKEERLPTAENQKTYYTHLTDTLRRYIEERFAFSAMEMTSDEIIEQLKLRGDAAMLQELSDLFRTADLVKFAKHKVHLNENDLNLVNAISFINSNKNEEKVVEERVKPQLDQDTKKRKLHRTATITAFWITGIFIALLLAYIIYNVYQLLN